MNVKSDGMAGYSMIYNENSIGRNSVTGNDFVSEISFARLKEAVLSKQNTKTITVTAIYFVFGLILWLFGILERNLGKLKRKAWLYNEVFVTEGE
ncbi:hypothetical protein AX774_g4064 [Zancudomyces culisetae]|uniref:Uncharacterized protein n=1 Tax=Zancudomyces culisetae TaxID=1213189 RepID=A0A1R1PNA9_ZANCU|nr:hypothetical protein AX774_g4064 [Zancudomyces culisetae]|eukprot:OMH82449.1 hypothetical protein AX774_g4064 [Zancudomyces culisetae]